MTGHWLVVLLNFLMFSTGHIACHVVHILLAREWRWELPFWCHKSITGGAPCQGKGQPLLSYEVLLMTGGHMDGKAPPAYLQEQISGPNG